MNPKSKGFTDIDFSIGSDFFLVSHIMAAIISAKNFRLSLNSGRLLVKKIFEFKDLTSYGSVLNFSPICLSE